MDGGERRGEAWPGPDVRARQRLPRVEDLPPGENGYDRERVHEAFDSFYRHIAQLDSTLRALEAVEVFRDQAGELRRELRALKAAGWTQQPWPASGPARVSPGLPESLPRFAIEAAFLIIVAVVVAVAGFDRLSIVLVMALAWAIVGVVEWAASRERFARAARVPAPVRPREEAAAPPAPLRVVQGEAASESWDAPAAALEPADEELTVVRPAADEPQDEPEQAEAPALEAPADPQLALEPAPAPDLAESPGEEAVVAERPAEQEAVVAEPIVEEPPDEEPRADEPEESVAAVAEEADGAASRWSWAADAAVERARERERAAAAPEPRRRFWPWRKREPELQRFDGTQPRHVRVLPPEPSFDERFPVEPTNGDDPWERDLDISIEEPEGSVDAEQIAEREAALDRPES